MTRPERTDPSPAASPDAPDVQALRARRRRKALVWLAAALGAWLVFIALAFLLTRLL